MRVAIHNPVQLAVKKNHTLYAYVVAYIRKYRPLIYLSAPKRSLRWCFWTVPVMEKDGVLRQLRELGIPYDDTMIITDVDELNRRADVLLGFNGEYFVNTPESRFKGLKVYHTQDFHAYCSLNNKALRDAGVQYVFCTGRLDKNSPLFRKHYPGYIGKVLSFPFGYSDRFSSKTPWERRKRKVFVTGSINPTSILMYPIHDRLVTVDNKIVHRRASLLERCKLWVYYHLLIRVSTKEYEQEYPGQIWAHPLRRMLVERATEFQDITTLKLPVYPQVKKFDFDILEEFNKHQLVSVDDGNIEFVGAKAYEAAASGCVVVCPRVPWFGEFGFKDDVNCIMYRRDDLVDFRRRVEQYLRAPKRLRRIRDAGMRLVTTRYNHDAIATMIQIKVARTHKIWKRRRR